MLQHRPIRIAQASNLRQLYVEVFQEGKGTATLSACLDALAEISVDTFDFSLAEVDLKKRPKFLRLIFADHESAWKAFMRFQLVKNAEKVQDELDPTPVIELSAKWIRNRKYWEIREFVRRKEFLEICK